MNPKELLIKLALWIVMRWAQERLPIRERVIESIRNVITEIPGPERIVEVKVEVPVVTVKERHILVPTDIPVAPKLIRTAEDYVRWAEDKFAPPDHSGEFRAHQVYALMIKKYPGADKSDLRLAIELAVRNCKVN